MFMLHKVPVPVRVIAWSGHPKSDV